MSERNIAIPAALSIAILAAVLGLTYLATEFWFGQSGPALLGAFIVLAVIILFAWQQFDRHRRAAIEQSQQLLQRIETLSISDAELQRAKEKAEAANEAKSRYVVGLSHELRTPLNAIMGYAQILERDAQLPENRRNSAQVIRRSAEHLSGLIDGLLDISKIETGRLQVYSNEINIQDFLDQIVDMFRLQAQAKGLEFRHIRAKSLPVYVRTDEKRLRQILVNLLSNAIKFTSSGHVRFEVGYRMQVATFTVEDTGSGIGPDDIEHIFEPFVRGEAEKNRFTPGLGLGLTITKLLTETLGGEITVSSEVGQGTRFLARLMLSKVERPSRLADTRNIVGYKGLRRTVMVVDDNSDHRALMRAMLEPLGFAVMVAEGGAACLAQLSEHLSAAARRPPHRPAVTLGLDPRGLHLPASPQAMPPRVKPEGDDRGEGLPRERYGGIEQGISIAPDIFFIDIRMPGMSGWDLSRLLRERGVTAPIIMLSANIGDGSGPVGMDPGHTDTIAKPFEFGKVLDRLGTHLALEWDYEAAALPASATRKKLVSPGAEHLRDLASLGQIGHVRGIEAKLDALAREPQNQPLVEALRRHLQAFDFDAYAETLEQVGHEPD